MDILQAIERAEQNINFAYKHPNYKRTVDLKKIYLQVLTGEEIDDLLPQFELREDKNLFKQRRALTIENLTPTISPICDKFYGVARIQPSKTVVAEKSEKQKYIEEAEKMFYNRQDIEAYMDDILDEVAISDPNAFLAIGFESFNEGDTPKIYPSIFGSEEVFDFVYKADGSLDFLFICQEVEVRQRQQSGRNVKNKRVYDYYCISEGNAIIYREIAEGRELNSGGDEWVSANGKKFQKKEIFTGGLTNTESQETPAVRLGYIQHKKHRAICVSPIHPAIPILRDMIRDKSEYDVSKRCHVFPQKVMYDDVCKGEVHIDESRRCVNGFISGTQDTCSVCQGTGFRPHRSGQEIIRIKRPQTKDEFLPIDQIITYVTTNLEAVKMLSDDMERNAVKVESAVFSSGMRQRSNMRTGQGQEMPTATQMVISTDDYNYVLDASAKNRSRWFCFIIRQIASVFDSKVDVTFKYSGKYVLETQEELINRLKSLADAGVSVQLINEADLRIAKVFFDNDEIGMKRYTTRAMFEPFRGRGADALTLLENENVSKSTKILFANFDQIFERIERENGVEFYDKKPADQKAVIDKIVDEIKGQLEAEQPAMILGLPKKLGVNDPQTDPLNPNPTQ